MAIKQYQKNGKVFYRIYCQARGKINKRLRLQRALYAIQTYEHALKEEKKLIRELAEEISRLEGKGLYWEDIIFRWEMCAKHGQLGDKCANPDYYLLHVKRLRHYTRHWLNQLAADLKKGEGRELINSLLVLNFSNSKINKLKSSINLIYHWGIEEKLISATSSPVEGLSLQKSPEKVPKILTLGEVKKLLAEAKRRNHPWYHIWAFALLSGMRSGELMALKWSDIELDKMLIRVTRSFNTHKKIEKSPKSGHWRMVPISPELHEIIYELKMRDQGEYVLPRMSSWANGSAGLVLRQFIKELRIDKDIVFHSLRACFATHLLSSGVEAVKVMAIGGWKDFKTFQIYIRMAGVDIAGATDRLSILPSKDDECAILQHPTPKFFENYRSVDFLL